MECVQESFKYGEMSSSQRKAVITLIEKQGKDRTLIPISLINVGAKIISKVVAVRVKNVLPNIIHHNRTGCVKDRYLGETVRSILTSWNLQTLKTFTVFSFLLILTH